MIGEHENWNDQKHFYIISNSGIVLHDWEKKSTLNIEGILTKNIVIVNTCISIWTMQCPY